MISPQSLKSLNRLIIIRCRLGREVKTTRFSEQSLTSFCCPGQSLKTIHLCELPPLKILRRVVKPQSEVIRDLVSKLSTEISLEELNIICILKLISFFQEVQKKVYRNFGKTLSKSLVKEQLFEGILEDLFSTC